jgi:nucleoid DNA-binding protein
MNRSDLIGELARRAGLSQDGARRTVEVLFGGSRDAGVIATALARGDRVQLAGFGTFETRQRRARPGLNPHTRQSIVIPASVAPAFRPATALKERCAAAGPGTAPAA